MSSARRAVACGRGRARGPWAARGSGRDRGSAMRPRSARRAVTALRAASTTSSRWRSCSSSCSGGLPSTQREHAFAQPVGPEPRAVDHPAARLPAAGRVAPQLEPAGVPGRRRAGSPAFRPVELEPRTAVALDRLRGDERGDRPRLRGATLCDRRRSPAARSWLPRPSRPARPPTQPQHRHRPQQGREALEVVDPVLGKRPHAGRVVPGRPGRARVSVEATRRVDGADAPRRTCVHRARNVGASWTKGAAR